MGVSLFICTFTAHVYGGPLTGNVVHFINTQAKEIIVRYEIKNLSTTIFSHANRSTSSLDYYVSKF